MIATIPCPPAHSATVGRPANPAAWAACRMLLPESFGFGEAPEAWLATDASTGAILGAAAARPRDGALHQLRIRVVRQFRRRGVGSLLLDCLAARRHGAIYASATGRDHEAAPFLLAHGFTRADLIYLAEGDLTLLRDRLFPLRERLLAGGRIPGGVRIVRPADASTVRMARLFAEHIAPFREFRAGDAIPLIGDPRLADSPVLCVEGEPHGMVLYESDPSSGVGMVHGRLVTEAYRGGWANVLLMAAAIERGLVQGVRRLRFEAPASNPDTMKLMRRVRADVLECVSCFVRGKDAR
jgi:GNAT superfamily N-acetyltransferase